MWLKKWVKNSRFLLTAMFIMIAVHWLSGSAQLVAQNSMAKVIGRVVDAQNGESIIGANIYFEATSIGAASDLDGTFIINNIPPGNYTLVVQMINYAELKITNFELKAGEMKRLDLPLKPEILTSEEVVVEARMILNNEATLLRERQKSNVVSDAISAESISRSSVSDAADAMKKVTGASVVDGKYVFVRGLGDRYNATMLNGAELPSMDPDKKSFQMDLLPSNLLDNIVTKKTFTPDEPGNFSGGVIDIGTKVYPEEFTVRFSAGVTYESETTGRNDFLTYPGGAKDWLGMDDGTRAIPEIVKDPLVQIPTPNSARRNAEQARFLDEVSHSFDPTMAPTFKRAPYDQSYSFSIGNQSRLFNKQLGYFGSLSYSRRYSLYNNGVTGRWLLSGNTKEVNELKNDLLLNDNKGSEEILWGGLLSLTFKPLPNHEFAGSFIRTQSGVSEARYQFGKWIAELSEGPIYETRSLLYTERFLSSSQLRGQHYFSPLLKTTVEWNLSLSSTKQDEPDLRFFSNEYRIEENNGVLDTAYAINNSLYNSPTRFWRDLIEDNATYSISFSIPFRQWNRLNSRVKLGASYIDTDRQFRERRFEFRQYAGDPYDGDPIQFFSPENIGIIDSTNGRYSFGNYISNQSTLRSNYDGEQKISAGFLLLELPLTRDIKLVGGARFETTRMNIISQDTTAPKGYLNNDDWLPSLSIIKSINDEMNIRLGYGKTLARPTFREMAPYTTFEFMGDYLYEGNASLQRTLINNFDLRWEWFIRPGEIWSVSAYYKQFNNPIERTVDPRTKTIRYSNVERGLVYGIEFETRKRLDQLWRVLKYFELGGNISLIYSKVEITSEEYELIKKFDPTAGNTRPLYGQSPYIVNMELGYHHPAIGTSASLYYNVAGSRLSEVTLGASPDIFEQPFHQLDFSLKQKIWRSLSLHFAVKNILASRLKKSQEFKGKEYLYQQYQMGQKYSLSLSYSL